MTKKLIYWDSQITKKLSVQKFSMAKKLSATEAKKLEIFLSFSYCNFKI